MSKLLLSDPTCGQTEFSTDLSCLCFTFGGHFQEEDHNTHLAVYIFKLALFILSVVRCTPPKYLLTKECLNSIL